ncbi:MAG TPA: hypothetical protein VIL26_03240 [Clostridia bacterium]
MVKFVKLVCSPKGTFWICVRRIDFWRDEVEIAVPNESQQLETVYKKTFFLPLNLFTTFAARLAEAFVI